jgi:hypothetical protein
MRLLFRRGAPLARFLLTSALTLTPTFNEALVLRAAGVDQSLDPSRDIWISHGC